MKKSFIIAIAAMVLATTVAVVSCKKDDQNETPTGRVASAADYAPGRIDDMNAYLKDFKGRMRNPSRDENTMLSLETDGMISMADLGTAYAQVADAIGNHLNNSESDGENVRFVGVSISDDGRVTLNLIMVFLDHVWYFMEDTTWIIYGISPFSDSTCHAHFNERAVYKWDELGLCELQRVLNLFESHHPVGGNTYFTATRDVTFEYPQCPDPYGSTFCRNSRTFANWGNQYAKISFNEMCYCLDSYLGLGYDYLIENPYVAHERPISWRISPRSYNFSMDHFNTFFHSLTVFYGQLHVDEPGPSED